MGFEVFILLKKEAFLVVLLWPCAGNAVMRVTCVVKLGWDFIEQIMILKYWIIVNDSFTWLDA